MMGTGYALLVSVSDYRGRGMADLMAGTADLCMMRTAVTEGLHFRKDNVRVLGEKGAVRLDAFAKALKEFAALLCGEDTFLLYVSGHGTGNTLCFSDEDVSVSSVVEVLAGMKARGRILILDSCFSGSATVPTKRQLHLDDPLSNFAGRGVAVMAAAASDEEAWLDESGRFSCYTGAVCAAMLSRKGIRNGRKSLAVISDNVRAFMRNDTGTCRQHPHYQAGMVGTIFFPFAEEKSFQKDRIGLRTPDFELCDVKSISTGNVRRLTAFLLTENRLDGAGIARCTKNIAMQIRDCSIYKDAAEEVRFCGITARAVWCYFGQDRMDLLENTCYAYGIWAADREMCSRLFHPNRNAGVIDGIYVWENPSYDLIRQMRQMETSPENYRKELDELLHLTVNQAESFITAFHRWQNGEMELKSLRTSHQPWYRDVLRTYNRVMDTPVPPEELHEWSDRVIDLAGWVMNMAIPLDADVNYEEDALRYLLRTAVQEYYESLELLREMEEL